MKLAVIGGGLAYTPELVAAARSVRLVLHGADKRAATARLLALDAFDPAWPASIVHDHPDAEIWVDEESAA